MNCTRSEMVHFIEAADELGFIHVNPKLMMSVYQLSQLLSGFAVGFPLFLHRYIIQNVSHKSPKDYMFASKDMFKDNAPKLLSLISNSPKLTLKKCGSFMGHMLCTWKDRFHFKSYVAYQV